ncbi:MAG: hypothetical protein CM1200mP22_18360 [Dehalococcoidia bacterium]|nr:MAG: hypothetical protein CM1200mP22_18360 [Dehalococcoidia bacterium]
MAEISKCPLTQIQETGIQRVASLSSTQSLFAVYNQMVQFSTGSDTTKMRATWRIPGSL